MRPGVSLVRSSDAYAEIDATAHRLGERTGLGGLLAHPDGLLRQARTTQVRARAVETAIVWEPDDDHDPRWWPQGVTSSADAEESETIDGRRLLVTSWYAKDDLGSRVSVLDRDTLRYRHVLLVRPDADGGVAPAKVHAGGLVWWGRWLHVAGTKRGLLAFCWDDLVRVDDEHLAETHGYRWVLPLRASYAARTDEGTEALRYSFVSLDRTSSPPHLVAGEYGRGSAPTRLARFALDRASGQLAVDPMGASAPGVLADAGVRGMQGVCVVDDRWYLTASAGSWRPGSLHVGSPGSFRKRWWSLPVGPEDLSYWPSTDELWSLSEYPGRRVVFSVRRAGLD
ncbi:hypothetical protein GCM10027425_30610 [Alteromonas gracilis]